MINKFFSFDEEAGKILLQPVNMGSDRWCLRDADDYFLEFGVNDFMDHEGVFLDDGRHLLQLTELDDYVCFVLKFNIKGRQVVVEEVTCRNIYKRSLFSIMPDRGMYTL